MLSPTYGTGSGRGSLGPDCRYPYCQSKDLTPIPPEVTFVPTARSFLFALGAVISITMITGMLGSRGVTSRSPLEVLRSEG